MQPTGDPAKWTAVGIPYMDAKSAIRLVSRMAPDVNGSGMDDVHRVVLDEGPESFFQAKQALAGVNRSGGGFLDLLVGAPILRSISGTERAHLQEILGPREFILFEKARVANRVVHVERAEVVGRQRRFPADGVAHGLNVLAVHLESLGRRHAARVQPSRPVADHPGHQVHLEKREPELLARNHAFGIDFGFAALVGVAIAADRDCDTASRSAAMRARRTPSPQYRATRYRARYSRRPKRRWLAKFRTLSRMGSISSGFRPTMWGFSTSAMPSLPASRTSPRPYTPWLVSILMIG